MIYKVLLVAEGDSRIVWGESIVQLFVAKNFQADIIVCKYYKSYITSKYKNIYFFSDLNDIDEKIRKNEYDVIILAVGGGLNLKVIYRVKEFFRINKIRPLIISGFNGVEDINDAHGLYCRTGSDFICISSPKVYERYKSYLNDLNYPVDALRLTGYIRDFHTFPEKRVSTNIQNVYFILQPAILNTRKELDYVGDKLIQFCKRHPQRNVFIKKRGTKNRHVHAYLETKYYKKFWDDLVSKGPQNLKFTDKNSYDVVNDADLIISFTSAMLLESLIFDKNVVALSDFGISKKIGNMFLLGSNLLAPFNAIIDDKIPKVSNKWKDENLLYKKSLYFSLIDEVINTLNNQKLRGLIIEPRKQIYSIKDNEYLFRFLYFGNRDGCNKSSLNSDFSTSKKLIKNAKCFLKIRRYSYINRIFVRNYTFYGWGRKKSGFEALRLSKKHKSSFILLEDGFIRSLGLGIDGYPAFSVVEDDIGIYYDATMPSRLENILNSYDFAADNELLTTAREAMMLIRKYNVSKYNNAPEVDEKFCQKYNLYKNKKNILIIAQTAGDSSLEYGLANHYSTDDMLGAAILENPLAKIYLKIHPDVLTGKKQSDIDIANISENIAVITENINPVSLLKYFDRVYTKTSVMGFEALLSDCECVCFGMPYYAGWGITDDRVKCDRRVRKLSIEEVFAAAYILYSKYYNPYKKRRSNIIDTINEIIKRR